MLIYEHSCRKYERYRTQEVQQYFRETKDGTRARYVLVISLIMQGRTIKEVKDITTFSEEWIKEIVARYNVAGLKALGDQRANNQGRLPTLTEEEEALVKKSLRSVLPMMASGMEQK